MALAKGAKVTLKCPCKGGDRRREERSSIVMFQKLAKALGVPVTELLG
jgi:hypothetical protein